MIFDLYSWITVVVQESASNQVPFHRRVFIAATKKTATTLRSSTVPYSSIRTVRYKYRSSCANTGFRVKGSYLRLMYGMRAYESPVFMGLSPPFWPRMSRGLEREGDVWYAFPRYCPSMLPCKYLDLSTRATADGPVFIDGTTLYELMPYRYSTSSRKR
ncbi:hypothetical protein L873DRAFT_1002052 [Choiromyces venosus 120613-1]|uniref:Uncharacterized protein n=1 Tax=Choiromyces venosus 120613-1 TaxID=1336337 RepID=A0A3N4JL20_9PEZI|nr:hypothetical protein L873DRAFT_1002052 [Choiromyces venosus 120613-1]